MVDTVDTVDMVDMVDICASRCRHREAGRVGGREASDSQRQEEREEGAALHRPRSARCRGSAQHHSITASQHHMEEDVFGFHSDCSSSLMVLSSASGRQSENRAERSVAPLPVVRVAPEPLKELRLCCHHNCLSSCSGVGRSSTAFRVQTPLPWRCLSAWRILAASRSACLQLLTCRGASVHVSAERNSHINVVKVLQMTGCIRIVSIPSFSFGF